MSKRLIVTADDFGRSLQVNQAVEEGHVDGILTAASLMVTEGAVDDAVERARRLPNLGVGLHVTLVDGIPALAPSRIPDLVNEQGLFTRDLVRLGTRIFLSKDAQRQVTAEMRAQFELFKATGLPLAHVDFHHHYHQHPTVFDLVLELAVEYGAPGIRIPWEPPLRSYRARGDRLGTRLLNGIFHWRRNRAMAAKARARGLVVNERAFGINDSGQMDAAKVNSFLDVLPDGLSEIYSHPATGHWTAPRPMPPHYRIDEEYKALIAPENRRKVAALGITLTTFAQEAARR
ncbi:hopanoid biosynthesis-associated protein HpnK [Magnetospirillum sp. 15-1]|uniref:hopanoid biosynthesis-associated protein HpnK n=1 Tax=Magnetospirillum sp. 15-1 TaxID=1979370 RepID=UPI000BBC602B|nr:hopanoid biosynthesis-associated protein HpnK [Magnetospirillum sp. 15-1]